MKAITTILLFLLLNAFCFAQTTPCEKIYNTPDSLAKYKTGKKDLHAYFQEKIIPILGDCIKQKLDVVYSMTIKLTIDATGKVNAVEFLKPELTEYCKTKLTTEMLQMQGWKPGMASKQNVCSVFIYPIAGIRWQ
ncbi:MAG: hypothetical protein H0W73_19005 [Bacteroidetes bacterium]|nr:hypothetical protein [Bacteroidota bacterium]